MLKSTKWKFIKQLMMIMANRKEGENNDSHNFFHIYISQNDSL